jgi:hypothetical protein
MSYRNPNHTDISPREVILGQEQFPSRTHLVGALVTKQLISADYAASGALDSFHIDGLTDSDSLRHILIGDQNGGAHHLPTIIGLEVEGRTIASKYARGVNPGNSESYYPGRKDYQDDQAVQINGVYKAKDVQITKDGKKLEKLSGSTMFPDTWNVEKVLEAVKEVGRTEQLDAKNIGQVSLTMHRGEVDGVDIKVTKHAKSGKIVTAFPVKTRNKKAVF